jgi:hypothetical protein
VYTVGHSAIGAVDTVPAVAYWATAVGTVAGAVVGGMIGIVTERLRAGDRRRERWLDLRRELAVRYLDATDQVWNWSSLYTNLLNPTGLFAGAGIRVDPASLDFSLEDVSDPQEAQRNRINAETRLRSLGTEIDLIGSDDERAAAMMLRTTMHHMGVMYDVAMRPDADDAARKTFQDARQTYSDYRSRFEEAAREGLTGTPWHRRIWGRHEQP